MSLKARPLYWFVVGTAFVGPWTTSPSRVEGATRRSRPRLAGVSRPARQAPAVTTPATSVLPGVSISGQEVTVELSPNLNRKETAWRVRWEHAAGRGLYLVEASFRKAPGQPFVRIVNQAGLSDIFVPYHSGEPRYWDLTMGFGLAPLTRDDVGSNGRLLADSNGEKVVALETRDRGILWKDEHGVRRGREFVLWGAVKAGNYYYLTQYGFLDDGTITFRMGATGRNLPGAETEAHMHSGLWRIDMALGDENANSVMLMRHREPFPFAPPPAELSGPGAMDDDEPFNNGVEGGIRWNPEEFTMVRVQNRRTNGQGKPISYDLMPMRSGTARHFGPYPREKALLYDIYVTPFNEREVAFGRLPDYIRQRRSIENTHVVLWYVSPAHHEPRSEDGRFVRQGDGEEWVGTTSVMWTGFDLRPRNFWDGSPLYPETAAQSRPAR